MRTPTPTPRRYAKEVTITQEHYHRAHGRAPRGYGTWMFAPDHAANERTPSGEPLTPNEAREQIHQLATAYRGNYAQAIKQAARDAAAAASQRQDTQPITIATLP
jgi:hypothetical protein